MKEYMCPPCNRARTYSGNPALIFCDRHYELYLASFQVHPKSLAVFRGAVIAKHKKKYG